MNKDDLLLVCPAEDWKSAKKLGDLTQYEVAQTISQGLGLKVTEANGKLYIDREPQNRPVESTPKTGNGIVYPSGLMLERHPENNAVKYAPARSSAPPLVRGDKSAKLSKHFRFGEFWPDSSAYTGIRIHPDLITLLEAIRERAGSIHVTSGYRPPAYNSAVGGVSNSYHLDGFASDIYSDSLSAQRLYTICDQLVGDSGGVGFYPSQGFVHVDVRGYRSRWTG